MKNNIGHLLIPRYELIADFPRNRLKIGTIILDNDLEYNFEKYPHLFKKLEWWEKRNTDEMPQYLNVGDMIEKIEKWMYKGTYPFAITSYELKEGYDMFFATQFNYQPATENEYLKYKSNEK